MSTVPIQVLKQHLAEYVDRAARGEHVVITRRNHPIAEIRRVSPAGVHVGSNVLNGDVSPLGVQLPPGALERALRDDRLDDR